MLEPPAAGLRRRVVEMIRERALPVDAGLERQWLVEGVAEAHVSQPYLPLEAHGQRQMVGPGHAGRGSAAVLDSRAVPGHVVAKRGQDRRERAVELVAVAAAAGDDPCRRLVRIEGRGPA